MAAWRMAQNNKTISSVTHPLQHFSRTDYSDALEEHDEKVSIGRNITNLRFADDRDILAEQEQELEALVAQGIRWSKTN